MKAAVMMIACALAMNGCATGYKKIGEGGTVMGYDDSQIKPGVYRVTYQEQSGSSPLKAYEGFLHRAAELTIASGSKFFRVTEGVQSVNQQISMAGLVNLPSYTGTVTAVPTQDASTINAQDIMARFAKEDAERKERAKAEAARAAQPANSSNPFRNGSS